VSCHPKSCHPSQCSATCNLFCLRLSHYVSARINCIVRLSRVPAASASAPSFAEGLISDAASVFKGIGHWAGFILFLAFPFIFFSSVPLGAAPRLPRRTRPGWLRRAAAGVGIAPDPARAGAPTRRGGRELGAAGRAPRLCRDTALLGSVGTRLPSRPSSRDPKRGARSLSPHLACSWWGASGRGGVLWHFLREFPREMKARGANNLALGPQSLVGGGRSPQLGGGRCRQPAQLRARSCRAILPAAAVPRGTGCRSGVTGGFYEAPAGSVLEGTKPPERELVRRRWVPSPPHPPPPSPALALLCRTRSLRWQLLVPAVLRSPEEPCHGVFGPTEV